METLWHVLSIIASLSVPFIAWLGKSYLDLHNRLIKAETLLDERSKTLITVRDQQIVDGHRLTQTEASVETLKEMVRDMRETSERRHSEISTKLELLPSINANLENLARICATIVPREVHEAQIDAHDARIRAIEEKVK